MFRRTKYLQYEAKPEKPDAVYAHEFQELIGGAWGEMTARPRHHAPEPVAGRHRGAPARRGLEETVAPDDLLDEEYRGHASSLWHLSDGETSDRGGWAEGTTPDGSHEFQDNAQPQPLALVAGRGDRPR